MVQRPIDVGRSDSGASSSIGAQGDLEVWSLHGVYRVLLLRHNACAGTGTRIPVQCPSLPEAWSKSVNMGLTRGKGFCVGFD